MAKPKVKRRDRLRVYLTLSFPNINSRKAYKTSKRQYYVFIDDELNHKRTQSSSLEETITVRLRSQIRIERRFDGKVIDSVFTYRVGENFATVEDFTFGNNRKKTFEVNFNERNFLEVITDSEYDDVKAID